MLEYDLKSIQDKKAQDHIKLENLLRRKEYSSLVYKIHRPRQSKKKELERKIVYERLKEREMTE